MSSIKCPQHKDAHIIFKEKGPHIGAYCEECGRWLKWLSAHEKKIIDLNVSIDTFASQANIAEILDNIDDDDCPF